VTAEKPAVPVVLCIDLEPDARQVTRDGAEWSGVRSTVEALEHWRCRLEAATAQPVHLSWFWRADPQITGSCGDAAWGFDTFRDVLDATSARGDAHGAHPHLWRRQAQSDEWISDNNPAWIRTCIDVALDAFARATGRPCELVRMGDRSLGEVAYERLAQRGVLVDLSVEPGELAMGIETVARGPDYTHAPTRPYRPRRRDITKPSRARRGPVLLPLSALVAREPDGPGPRLRTVYPWLADSSELATRLLDEGAPYLAFAVRSDIGIRPEIFGSFERMLTALASHDRARSLRFVTPESALAMLGSGPLGNFRPLR
jgi:hypothetical protein